ncbi:sensor histidine kinase [Clostridium formicaceticum]|uniref:histidine kinase n=1 Tax=Clostridium formicaceticum TaxID=1497 RepID=A0AAC9RKK8_9CLOT|nr:HAMP domain-containing sensor histidine kinase [Clostridium formicaceticum]AOY76584.1 hypothetical protein BJL90_12365 [Clostridium formicaceticum]ARE87003.1 Alkaline phosphatase synthesis sensor protein PhoR [Clostridium formicaceticum]
MKIKSIFTRLFLFFLLFTMMMVAVLWLIQMKFLPQYYQHEKVKILEGYAKEIEAVVGRSGLDHTSLELVESIAAGINGRVAVFDKERNMLYHEGMTGQFRGMRVPSKEWQAVLSGKTTFYHVSGTRQNSEFLVVVVPGEQYVYLMQIHFQTIEEAISITRGFYIYLLGIGIIVALLLAAFFSRKLIHPLLKLNSIAKEMTNLNFNVKWEENRQDEIGQLGETLNFLTDRLQVTIGKLEKELAKEKNLVKMRKEFVSRVSHELQTPISIISGYIEALQDDIAVSEEEVAEYFTIIEMEIHRMSRLIREMLDLGQLESGTFRINMEKFNYGDLINRVLGKFELMKKEKELLFEIKGNGYDSLVLGDEYRIEQVLTNLLQNAVNHAYHGGSIKLSIDDEGTKIWTSIYNDGEKILEEDIPCVWESFYKGGKEKGGTGLGLAIVKNVLELHGSSYGVKNTNNGVCFYFDLKKYSR